MLHSYGTCIQKYGTADATYKVIGIPHVLIFVFILIYTILIVFPRKGVTIHSICRYCIRKHICLHTYLHIHTRSRGINRTCTYLLLGYTFPVMYTGRRSVFISNNKNIFTINIVTPIRGDVFTSTASMRLHTNVQRGAYQII